MESSNGEEVQRPRSMPFEPYGKVLSFEIILDRQDGPNGVGIYCPGDVLTGHVRLELSQRLTVNNLDLLVQGTGNAAWRLRTLQGDEFLADDEVYLNEIAELVGKRRNEMVTLSAGEHVFPFACDLPLELPATFTGSHGNISYLVKVVIQADRNEPAHREPCVTTNIFLVESRLSLEGLGNQLNSYRIDYKHPVKTSGLSTGSSSVKVSLFMPRRAYDIGDNLVVNLSLTNSSRKAVKSMSLALVMEAEYRVRDRVNTERLLVADHEDAFAVRHLESRQWRHVGLAVPRCIPPSGLPHSSIISIKYWLVFKAELERSQDPVMVQTPVLIGLQLPEEMKLDTIDSSLVGEVNPGEEAASRSGGSARILYHGRQEPQVNYRPPAGSSAPPQQRPLQQPLYVDVTQQKPMQQPKRQQPQQQQQRSSTQLAVPQTVYQPLPSPPKQQRQHQPRQGSPDSQIITMRFADELDDRTPYGQPQQLTGRDLEQNAYAEPQQQQQHPQHHPHSAKVSRNPLYSPDEDGQTAGPSGYSNGSYGGFQDGAHGRHLGAGASGSNGHYNGGGVGHDERMTSALDASLNNDAEEVLY